MHKGDNVLETAGRLAWLKWTVVGWGRRGDSQGPPQIHRSQRSAFRFDLKGSREPRKVLEGGADVIRMLSQDDYVVSRITRAEERGLGVEQQPGRSSLQ